MRLWVTHTDTHTDTLTRTLTHAVMGYTHARTLTDTCDYGLQTHSYTLAHAVVA